MGLLNLLLNSLEGTSSMPYPSVVELRSTTGLPLKGRRLISEKGYILQSSTYDPMTRTYTYVLVLPQGKLAENAKTPKDPKSAKKQNNQTEQGEQQMTTEQPKPTSSKTCLWIVATLLAIAALVLGIIFPLVGIIEIIVVAAGIYLYALKAGPAPSK